MTDENKIDVATSQIAQEIYKREKQTIENSRKTIRELEAMRKKYGWRFFRGSRITLFKK